MNTTIPLRVPAENKWHIQMGEHEKCLIKDHLQKQWQGMEEP